MMVCIDFLEMFLINWFSVGKNKQMHSLNPAMFIHIHLYSCHWWKKMFFFLQKALTAFFLWSASPWTSCFKLFVFILLFVYWCLLQIKRIYFLFSYCLVCCILALPLCRCSGSVGSVHKVCASASARTRRVTQPAALSMPPGSRPRCPSSGLLSCLQVDTVTLILAVCWCYIYIMSHLSSLVICEFVTEDKLFRSVS